MDTTRGKNVSTYRNPSNIPPTQKRGDPTHESPSGTAPAGPGTHADLEPGWQPPHQYPGHGGAAIVVQHRSQQPAHDDFDQIRDQYNAALVALSVWPMSRQGDATALAGEVTRSAHLLLLALSRQGKSQECERLVDDIGKFLNDSWEAAGRPVARNFNLLESAPLELLTNMYGVACGELEQFVRTGLLDVGLAIDMASRLKRSAQCLMVGQLRDGNVMPCGVVLQRAGFLLNQAWSCALQSTSPEFRLLEPAPDELLGALAAHRLLPGGRAADSAPTDQQPALQVGSKRTARAAGITQLEGPRPLRLAREWGDEAKPFLDGFTTPGYEFSEGIESFRNRLFGLPSLTAKLLDEFAGCGTAAMCYLCANDEKTLGMFTGTYLEMCVSILKNGNVTGRLRQSYKISILNSGTPRSVVGALRDFGPDVYDSLRELGMLQSVGNAIPEFHDEQDWADFLESFVPGQLRKPANVDAYHHSQRLLCTAHFSKHAKDFIAGFGIREFAFIDKIKSIRLKLKEDFTAERLAEFTVCANAAMCYLLEHAGKEKCNEFAKVYLDLCRMMLKMSEWQGAFRNCIVDADTPLPAIQAIIAVAGALTDRERNAMSLMGMVEGVFGRAKESRATDRLLDWREYLRRMIPNEAQWISTLVER